MPWISNSVGMFWWVCLVSFVIDKTLQVTVLQGRKPDIFVNINMKATGEDEFIKYSPDLHQ